MKTRPPYSSKSSLAKRPLVQTEVQKPMQHGCRRLFRSNYLAIAVIMALFISMALLSIFDLVMHGDQSPTAHTTFNPAGADGSYRAMPSVDAEPSDTRQINWEYWQSINGDVVAWLEIPATHVDLPLVQASPASPAYYLTHSLYRDESIFGAPYLDAECSLASPNVVILGHNTRGIDDEAMFSELTGYTNAAFMAEHPTMVLYTPGNTKTLTVLGAERLSGGSPTKRTDFGSAEDLHIWLARRLQAAACVSAEAAGVVEGVREPARIYTLATCSFDGTDDRIVVYAVER